MHYNDRGRMTPCIHHGAQDKHLVGKKHDGVRSILTEPPEYLAQWVGKRSPSNKVPAEAPNYRERVDFGFVIEIWHGFDEASGKVTEMAPTTWGIIRYSKHGIHIRPSKPK